MDNKSDDQLLIMQARIEANRQGFDKKIKNLTEELTEINKGSPKAHYHNTVVPANKKALRWKVGILQKMVAHRISNMRSYQHNYLNCLSRHNSKAKLIWTSMISTTT